MKDAITALYGMVVRPDTALCRISENPAVYFAPSVIIFAVSISSGVLFPVVSFGHQADENISSHTPYALIMAFVQGMVLILAVFWIGRRFGGNRSLRRAFSALAYCWFPRALGAAVTAAANALYSSPMDNVHSDLVAGSFAVEFIVQNAIGLFFVGWIFLLAVKAIRTINGFRYPRSVAVLLLAILAMYAASMIQGVATIAIDEFVLVHFPAS